MSAVYPTTSPASLGTAAEDVSSPARDSLPTIQLCGQSIHRLSESDCVTYVMEQLADGAGGWIVTANLDHLRRLAHNRAYRELIAPAELVVADGKPLIWAARLQGFPLPGVVAGSNLVWSLTAAAVAGRRSIYFLGGVPGAAETAVRVLAQKYPGLQVAGVSSPVVRDPADDLCIEPIRAALVSVAPDIVYVALGSPKQEQLIAALKSSLPHAWWIGVGISFSYVAGDVPRAPLLMQRSGLEWFFRLWQEPRRLAKRYLLEGLPFAAVLFGRSVLDRFRYDRRSGPGRSSR